MEKFIIILMPGQLNYNRVLNKDLTWQSEGYSKYSIKKFNTKKEAKDKLKELYEKGKDNGFGYHTFYIKEIIEF